MSIMPASSRVLLAVGVGLVAFPIAAEEAPTGQPQIPLSQTPSPDTPLSSLARVLVRGFVFQGNTVFSEKELAAVVAPFTNREVSAEELEEARRKLTEFYIQKGFINSGAILEEQNVADGIIKFRITEGRLTGISIRGNRYFQAAYLKNQVKRASRAPLNVISLRDSLQLLRQNANIGRLNAEVLPGTRPGEATLDVEIEEIKPFRAALELDNHRPASVGAERLRMVISSLNLTGRDDSLSVRSGLTRNGLDNVISGLQDFGVNYQSPELGRTRLQIAYSKGDSAVIEEPFALLNISSRSENVALSLRQSLERTLTRDSGLLFSVERRQSQSFLAGRPFSFSPGDVNGKSATTALRFGSDFLNRKSNAVLAGRVLLSWGGNFPGSTRNVRPPNGRFLTVLGQIQKVRVLDNKGRQVILRLDGQWANKPLLSVEKFSVGGARSVRGYRENQLVRDKGLAASVEGRIPVLYDKAGRERLSLAPFLDMGYGKNKPPFATAGSNTLASVGLGLLYNDNKRLGAQLYYGHALRRVNTPGNDLQDKGLHFALSWQLQ